ncbi:hypothetical protein ACIBL8_47195 [Streptomyces sp. NPDC050523]|uniref:hypothetical protein n=1 Tax=Streptomyces sp. NPDC050523 TaxID=3365622 RepID=UPI0037892C1A
MPHVDSVATGLVDQFFAQCRPEAEPALSRWREAGELDRITVSRLRLWVANRALEALARPSSSPYERASAVRERQLLIDWLEANGHQDLA